MSLFQSQRVGVGYDVVEIHVHLLGIAKGNGRGDEVCLGSGCRTTVVSRSLCVCVAQAPRHTGGGIYFKAILEIGACVRQCNLFSSAITRQFRFNERSGNVLTTCHTESGDGGKHHDFKNLIHI